MIGTRPVTSLTSLRWRVGIGQDSPRSTTVTLVECSPSGSGFFATDARLTGPVALLRKQG